MSQQRFLDEVKVYFKAGDGGNGCIAFHREKYMPKGGPSGGNGGRGGNIYLVADENLHTLNDFLHGVHFKASHGQHGMGSRCNGQNANDLQLHVPRGTLVTIPETGEILADLAWPGQLYVAARGGIGGRGNASFASHVYRLPRFAQRGEPGEERWLRLVLKMIAQVGIIGFPNAGKSTLLSRISRATPKIADYPFTTLVPNLGMVWLDDLHRAVFADIPGLIEGAHGGVGLGDRFLRHVERTRALVHLVDASNIPADDPLRPYITIREELRLYGKGLDSRVEVVVLNKSDLLSPEAREKVLDAYREAGMNPLLISALEGEGLAELIKRVADELARERESSSFIEDLSDDSLAEILAAEDRETGDSDVLPESLPADGLEADAPFADASRPDPIGDPRDAGGEVIERDAVLVPPSRRSGRSVPARFTVRRDGDVFRVEGRALERMVAMTDLTNDEGVRWLQHRLERMGVEDALKQAGATHGAAVTIRGFEFEFAVEQAVSSRPTRKQKRLRGMLAKGNPRRSR